VFGGLAGHAGLFSTAGDLARLAVAMVQPAGSDQPGSGLFLPQVVREFTRPFNGNDFYGWVSPTRWQSLAPWHEPLARHGALLAEGFTGCLLLVIPTQGIACSFLTNRLHQPDAQAIKPPALYAHYAAVVGAVVDHAL
jgi:CubicO group peptidase (beta-lactamase class C family)